MKEIKTTGMICIDDSYGFTYNVGKIEYIECEDESYKLFKDSIAKWEKGYNLQK